MDFYCGVGLENGWMAQVDRPGQRVLDVYLQMGHYDRWEDDLRLARDLGINALRYSVPWYRSHPAPGRYDWDWISRPLDWLLGNAIVPIVDLLHYGTPVWMENGILHRQFPERFAEYAAAFAKRFDGAVTHYTPVNEPQTSATLSGYGGPWPPYLKGIEGWLRLCLPLAKSIVLSSQALRSSCRNSVLISADCTFTPGFAELARTFGVGCGELDEASQLLHGFFPASLAYGTVRGDTEYGRALLSGAVTETQLDWFRTHAQPPDIFGFNYYPNLETTTTENARDHLLATLVQIGRTFSMPVYVMETSSGLTEEKKVQWVRSLGDLVRLARANHLPLVGINWWPLFETIQWEYRDNGKPVEECIVPGGWNNGLYVIDKRGGNLDRVATRAVGEFKQLACDLLHRTAGEAGP